MELIRDLHNLKSVHRPCVATIGNFDGVHQGHQVIIRQLQRHARETGLPAVVITFEPQPMEYFAPEAAPARLTAFREKLELFAQFDVDRVFCLRFSHALATLPAQRFVEDLLVARLGVQRVIVGDDFRFGKGRAGDFSLLQRLGRDHGFDAIPTETFSLDGERVSSSRIRAHLAAGEFERAAQLLGRPYYISGRVLHGDKRGTGLGFPTANLLLKRKKSPLSGIFAVTVHGLGESVYQGVASIGTRPVFGGTTELLEVHLFDFNERLYGRRIHVEFMQYLRPESNFDSPDALVEQMHEDARQARTYFAEIKNNRFMTE